MAMLVVGCYSCRQTEDRCVFCPPTSPAIPSSCPTIPYSLPSSLPPSTSPNLGLIVSVIKHSCTDPSPNPLSSADYTGVRGLALPESSHTAVLPTLQCSTTPSTQIIHVKGGASCCWTHANTNCSHLMFQF